MSNLLLALFLFFSLNSFGQEIECQYPPSGDCTGTCEAFYLSGNIRSQTDFVNSLRHGNHLSWYENGQLAASANYYRESYIGEALRYSEEGVVIFKMVLDSNETGEFFLYAKDGDQIQ